MRLRFPVTLLVVACSASVPAPLVATIAPAIAFEQLETRVVLTGTFSPRVKVDFERPDASVRDAQFTVRLVRDAESVPLDRVTFIDRSTLEAVVPRGVPAGAWTVVVLDSSSREARLVDALTVLDCTAALCTLADGGVFDAGPPGSLPDGGRRDGGSAGDAGDVDAGPIDAGPQPCATTTLADDDLDGFGKPGTEAQLCGIDRVTTAGDCDDVDPGTHLGAPEFCNLIDDDCDGNIDEGVCPVLNPNWIRRLDSPTDREWATASAFGVGRLWVGGRDDVLLREDGGFFEEPSASCPNDLTKSFVNGATAIFAGGNPALGRLATHAIGAPGCANVRMLSDPVAGLFLELDAGATVSGVLRNGRLFSWLVPGQPVERSAGLSGVLNDAARGADGALYGVGASAAGMQVWRLGGEDAGWLREPLSLPSGALHAVAVRSATSVFVGGEQGVVMEKLGNAWRRLPDLSGTVTSLTAFNPARVYATTSAGAVHRWNGRQWRLLYSSDAGVALNDLAGVSESDLWVVGTRGFVVHWAE